MNDGRIYSVSELNAVVHDMFDRQPFFHAVSVAGELSNCKIYPSGHMYFTLKDSQSALKCVMFRTNVARLRFRPESGQAIIACGNLTVYDRDGVYQLSCTSLIPAGTGDLQLAFEQLKRKLSQEGLFEPENKKPLPRFPHRIVVITSSAGAAIHDILRILRARWPLTDVVLIPVRVQGVEAPPEIVTALAYANRWKLGDLIITGRGGGSIEDLWAFNDERVVRAIAASDIPVISAVGHEPDVTLSDYAADLRAATPSNAAELAVPHREDLQRQLSQMQTRLCISMSRRLTQWKNRMDVCQTSISPDSLQRSIDRCQQDVDRIYDQLCAAQVSLFSRTRAALNACCEQLKVLAPTRTLERGYSIVRRSGIPVNSVADIQPGESLEVIVSDGIIMVTVQSVESAVACPETPPQPEYEER